MKLNEKGLTMHEKGLTMHVSSSLLARARQETFKRTCCSPGARPRVGPGLG